MTRKINILTKLFIVGADQQCCIFVFDEENCKTVAEFLKANGQALKMGVNAVNRIFI